MYTRSFECLVELYKLLELDPPTEYDEELLQSWKSYIQQNKTFCVDRLLSTLHPPIFIHAATHVNIPKIAHTRIEELDYIPRLAQCLRKIYNNMESDESLKIRSKPATSIVPSSTQSRPLPTSEFDMNWLMNIAGLIMNISQNHKDKIDLKLLVQCLPEEVRESFVTCETFIRLHTEELVTLDPVDVAYKVLSDDDCRMALKHAYPFFTQSRLKSTIDTLSSNMSKALGLGDTSQGVPPMMASILSMLNNNNTSPNGMPDLASLLGKFQ